MRTFHTNTKGEVSGLLGDQIGRSTSIPESSSPILMNDMKKSSPLQKPKVFSNRSRVSSMKENLRHGSMYLTNQIETIGKLDQAFSNLHKQCTLISGADGKIPQILLPSLEHSHNTIRTLSELSFMNHPLFGYGYENPIRIHLKIGSDEIIHPIPICPLLGAPVFQAMLISKSSTSPPSDSIFEESKALLINLMLNAQKEKTGIDKLMQRVEGHASGHLNRLLNNGDESNTRKMNVFMKTLERFLRTFRNPELGTA